MFGLRFFIWQIGGVLIWIFLKKLGVLIMKKKERGNYKSYKEAYRKGGHDIWPGCGGKRKKECGRLHDFSYIASDGVLVHRFHCWQNWMTGCPPGKEK